MGWFLVVCDAVRRLQFLHSIFEIIQALLKSADVLLLTKDFGIQFGNGIILQRRQAFELIYSLFHEAEPSIFLYNGEWIHPLLR